jgi:c(7)-type cytochrome triheme protein
VGKNVKKEYDYASFTEKLPKENLGDLIDWQEAESKGLIQPVDFLPGISISRLPLNVQKDFRIKSKGWMPNVTFSHKKHALWNGCELCHPDIFPSVKKGTVKYSMFQIFDEQYCGLCHGRVAFPLYQCQKCHTNPMPR